ncbi:MAG: T9SS type A sorting domain-containing protein [Bacteroidales bacterium]
MNFKLLFIPLFCLLQLNISAQTWLKVSCGTEFSVALRSDSTLWAWGANMNGQLGIGNLNTVYTPVQIGSDHNWKDIVAAAMHCLALKSDGSLWAWGLNANGQLGNAGNTNSSFPVKIGNATDWEKIYAGQAHSFSIKTDGSLWAWGYNYSGQLGDGSHSDKNIPTQLGSNTNWKEISAGGFHTLALKTNGSLWAWGYNGDGELGDSTTFNDSIPKQIGNDTNWTKVSAGFMYSLALKSDGSLWAWGFNGNGQLGIGANIKSSKTTAELQAVQIGEAVDWKNVIAGSSFAFAIKNDSSLWGWGYNYYGQLGNGNTVQLDHPVKIGNDNNWKTVAAATGFLYNSAVYGLHSSGLKYQGSGICVAGANYIGQLGNGTTTDLNLFDCNTGITGISEIIPENTLLVYPNPARDFISFETPFSGNSLLYIFNSLGKCEIKKQLSISNNSINIKLLKQGIYYYQLIDDKAKVINGKFLKE